MYVELQRFLDAIERLLELYRRELLRFEVTPHGVVALVFDDEADDRPEPGGGLYVDLQDAIGAAAAGTSVEDFVKVRTKPRPNFTTPEESDVTVRKYEAAQRLVAEARVQERVFLSVTSKIPVLSRVEWEVVNREADSSGGPGVQTGRYGILRLTAERATVDSEDARNTVLAVDAERMDLLLDDLAKLRQALTPETIAAGAEAEKATQQ